MKTLIIKLITYFKNKKTNSIKDLLKEHKIPYSKFLLFYWLTMCQSFFIFSWSYFRYFMLLIFRRSFIVWTTLIAYANLTINEINKYLNLLYLKYNELYLFFNNALDIWHKIIYIIIFILLLYILFKVFGKLISKIYNFFFIYRDLLDFNKKIENYYEDKIYWFIKSNSSKEKNTTNNIDNLIKEKNKNINKKENIIPLIKTNKKQIK